MSDTLPVAVPLSSRTLRRRDRRDQQIRRIATNLRKAVPHLNRPEFTPIIRAFAMLTLTLERSYAALRDKDPISPTTNELRSSYDVIGRLAAHHAKLAAQLGLSPAAFNKLKTSGGPDDLAAALAGGK
jgi:hypothetical protein